MNVRRERVESVDLLRGVIMIVMALDHVREYLGAASANPTNLATTTVPLFLTRWVTHFCAPVFFLLVGTGARLALQRRTPRELAWFLVTRGLWLISLEFTLLRLVQQFNLDYRITLLTVMWSLGWSMIALAPLVFLDARVGAVLGVVLIAGHNALDSVRPAAFGALAPVWSALHVPNVLYASANHVVFASYPLIPWIGVTAFGYWIGTLFERSADDRRRLLVAIGAIASLAFVVVRGINVYGDPVRWSAQTRPVMTALSFLNTTKYPPSLSFLLMTLGPALMLLVYFDRGAPSWLRPALVIGRVPLFYFLVHMLLAHIAATIVCAAQFGDVHWMFESPTLNQFPITKPPGWGLSLPAIYATWIGVVLAAYPLCRWFADLRRRRGDWWLSYL